MVADLGVPSELIERTAGDLHLLVAEQLSVYLIPRPLASHKGDFGHVVIVAGSVGKAGAAILTARAAVRGGAGLVTVAVPEPIVQTVDLGSIESMTLALPVDPSGALTDEAVGILLEFCQGKQAIAVGPGLGTRKATVSAVQSLVQSCELPVVLDADGVNAFASVIDRLSSRRADTVLTPHPGELGRLLSLTAEEIQADRVGAARLAAARSGAIVVLKGHQTLIAEPGGRVFVNVTGNPGMATGGTGDVLTGLIASLIGQGYEALTSAQLGVYLHGLAGDLAAESSGVTGLAATDLLTALPAAFEQLTP